MSNWFVRKSANGHPLEPGSIFRNVRSGNLVETARVLSITKDGVGIPHVRFDKTLDCPGKPRLVEARRILCLAAFTQQFPERVVA